MMEKINWDTRVIEGGLHHELPTDLYALNKFFDLESENEILSHGYFVLFSYGSHNNQETNHLLTVIGKKETGIIYYEIDNPFHRKNISLQMISRKKSENFNFSEESSYEIFRVFFSGCASSKIDFSEKIREWNAASVSNRRLPQ